MSQIKKIAIAVVEDNGRFLVGPRCSDDPLNGLNEFPGGKVKKNETFEKALLREIKEELNIIINLHDKIAEEKYKDEKIDILLHYYLCTQVGGTIQLIEHEDLAWVEKKDFKYYDFAEGDKNILLLL